MDNISGYELSRKWFNFCFENPDKVKPIHSAIYFFSIEHCNRLGWKNKFGFPSQMVMEALGVKNWRTYSKAINDLIEFGFIEMIEFSRNQYSSNIISIQSAYVKNTKAQSKALDKALQKHSQKQHTKQGRSTVSIDKQITNNKEQLTSNKNEIDFFEKFWNLYDKKIGKKDKIEIKWKNLTLETQNKILEYIPKYKISQPDKKYRKNPETFLNNESWNDEIIKQPKQKNNSKDITFDHSRLNKK